MKKTLADQTIAEDEKMRYLVMYECKSPLNAFRLIGRLAKSG